MTPKTGELIFFTLVLANFHFRSLQMYIFAAVYFSFATQVSELSQFIKSWASLFTARSTLLTDHRYGTETDFLYFGLGFLSVSVIPRTVGRA